MDASTNAERQNFELLKQLPKSEMPDATKRIAESQGAVPLVFVQQAALPPDAAMQDFELLGATALRTATTPPAKRTTADC